jgi:hypothetical protein
MKMSHKKDIEGYTYSHKYGAIVGPTGRAITDAHGGGIGGELQAELMRVAYKYFYNDLKAMAGYRLDEVPEALAGAKKLVEGVDYEIVVSEW